MNLQTKYKLLKATTIVIGALNIPWGTFIGFSFGAGHITTGLVGLCLQVVVSLTDGFIWFWVLENMKTKIDKEPAKPTQPKLPYEATA